MSFTIDNPVNYFSQVSKFGAVGGGSLYIGVVDGDPANVPADRIQVYKARQNDTDLAISQPIELSPGGVPMHNGSAITIKNTGVEFSMQVLDSQGQQIFYSPKSGEIAAAILTLQTQIANLDFVLPVDTFSDLATTPAPFAGMVVYVKQHTSGGVGGGHFEDTAGTITNNDVTLINNTITSGRHWKRINYDYLTTDMGGGDFDAVVDAAADGATIYVAEGAFTALDRTISRDNLTIIGAGMPVYNGTDRLVGGTILRGRLIIDGSNITLKNIGIDRGDYVTDTFFSGVAADALVVHDAALSVQHKNNHLENVIGLLPDGVAYHAVLYEKQEQGTLKNVEGIGGDWGVVIKGQKITFDTLKSSRNTQGGVVIKSDSYAPCTDVTGVNVLALSPGWTSGFGFYCYAATEQMQNIVVNNIITDGYSVGKKLVCDPRASWSNPMNDCSFDNIVIRNADDFGFESFGGLANVNIGMITISDTVSGKAFRLDDNAFQVSIGVLSASAPAALGSPPADCVYLGGDFTVGQLQSTKGYDITQPTGVTVSPSVNREWAIGSLLGTLNLDTNASALQNGWTGAFSSVPTCKYENGYAYLSGRIAVPGTPWTGKEVCYQCSASLAPKIEKYFMAGAYDGSLAVWYSVLVTVKTNGQVEITQLNTASAFPTTVTWLALDGIRWEL